MLEDAEFFFHVFSDPFPVRKVTHSNELFVSPEQPSSDRPVALNITRQANQDGIMIKELLDYATGPKYEVQCP